MGSEVAARRSYGPARVRRAGNDKLHPRFQDADQCRAANVRQQNNAAGKYVLVKPDLFAFEFLH